jgi:hypothetical protein
VLALAAAVVAIIYLILDWAGVSSDLFNAHTGLLICVALIGLHLAGIGVGGNWRYSRTRNRDGL